MERNDDLIDLGAASVETKGVQGNKLEAGIPFAPAGISDE